MTFRDFRRLTNIFARKIFLLIDRTLIGAVNNEGESGFYDSGDRSNPQRMQLTGSESETLTDIERFQEYGLESYPVPDDTSEAVLLSPDGSRDNAFIIKVQDHQYRPTDLVESEVCAYGPKDKDNQQHRIHFKTNGDIEVLVDSGSKISLGNGTDEVLALIDDSLTEVIDSLKFIRDTITFSNGGGPTGPPTNGSLLTTQITNLETAQTALGNLLA